MLIFCIDGRQRHLILLISILGNLCAGGGGGHGGSTFGGRQAGRRRDHGLVGTTVKIRIGPFKGYRGRVVDATDIDVRIELESQMKVVTGVFFTSAPKRVFRFSS